MFTPGHPKWGGKKVGSLTLRSQEAIDLFTKFQFDPLAEKIQLAKSVKGAIVRASDPAQKLDYRRLYSVILEDLTKRCYPMLKSVEHTGQVDHIHHTMADIEGMSDAELQALIVTMRHERHLDDQGG